MDVHDKLDELITIVEEARSMPMSASCIINRGEVLALLEEVRALLPEEFRHAQLLLADRPVRQQGQHVLGDGLGDPPAHVVLLLAANAVAQRAGVARRHLVQHRGQPLHRAGGQVEDHRQDLHKVMVRNVNQSLVGGREVEQTAAATDGQEPAAEKCW